MKNMSALNGQDKATIRAALRFYQKEGMGEPANRADDIHDLATDNDNVVSHDSRGIRALIKKIR